MIALAIATIMQIETEVLTNTLSMHIHYGSGSTKDTVGYFGVNL